MWYTNKQEVTAANAEAEAEAKRLKAYHDSFEKRRWWHQLKLILLLVTAFLTPFALAAGAYFFATNAGAALWQNMDDGRAMLDIRLIFLFIVLVVIPTLLVAMMAFSSLFPPRPESEGIRVSRVEAPALWDAIDNVRTALDTAKIHDLYITRETNARILEFPVFGPFWMKRTIFIGLPLIALLSPKELESVIAHELGHTSGKVPKLLRHGSYVSTYIYTFGRDAHEMETDTDFSVVALPLKIFSMIAATFIRPIEEHMLPLLREGELVADAAAGATYGAAAGDALIKLRVDLPLTFGAFQKTFMAGARDHEEPPVKPHRFLLQQYPAKVDEKDRTRLLADALDAQDDPVQAHPALATRLDALGHSRGLPAQTEKNYAPDWLGDSLEEIIKEFDYQWYRGERSEWQQEHAHFRSLKGRRAVLEAKKTQGEELTIEDHLDWLQILDDFGEKDTAREYCHALYKDHPDHPSVQLWMGHDLLDRDEEKAQSLLEAAAKAGPAIAYHAHTALGHHFQMKGDEQRYKHFADLAFQNLTLCQEIQQDRSSVSITDCFLPHSVDEADYQSIQAFCSSLGNGIRCYLLNKKPNHAESSEPITILAFDKVPGLMQAPGSANLIDRAQRDLSDCPIHLFVNMSALHNALSRKMAAVAGAEVRLLGV